MRSAAHQPLSLRTSGVPIPSTAAQGKYCNVVLDCHKSCEQRSCTCMRRCASDEERICSKAVALLQNSRNSRKNAAGIYQNLPGEVRPCSTSFKCPVTLELMANPVATVNGHVYEREEILSGSACAAFVKAPPACANAASC